MSEQTWQAVEDAIRAHMAEENDGAYLTGWVSVCVAVSAKNPDMAHYQYMNHKGPSHEWMGLLEMGHQRSQTYYFRQELFRDDEDEDGKE